MISLEKFTFSTPKVVLREIDKTDYLYIIPQKLLYIHEICMECFVEYVW